MDNTVKKLGKWPFYALLIGLVIAGQWFMNRNLVSGPAPPLQGTTLDGQSFDLQRIKGQPAVVYFWATWCKICGAMKDTIADIARDYPVISIATQSGSAKDIAAKANLATIADPDGRIGQRFGIRGVPTAFILDKDGNIRYTAVGYTTELGLRARLWLAKQ